MGMESQENASFPGVNLIVLAGSLAPGGWSSPDLEWHLKRPTQIAVLHVPRKRYLHEGSPLRTSSSTVTFLDVCVVKDSSLLVFSYRQCSTLG